MGRRRILVLVDRAGLNPATEALLNDAQSWSSDTELRFVVRHSGNIHSSLAVLGQVWQVGQPIGGSRSWIDFALNWAPDVIYAASLGALSIGDQVEMPLAPLMLFVYDDGNSLGQVSPGRKSAFIDRPDLYVAPTPGCAQFLTERLFIPAGKIVASRPIMMRRQFQHLAATPRVLGNPIVVGSVGGIEWLSGPIQWLYLARELMLSDRGEQFAFRRLGLFDGSIEDQRFRHSMRLLEVEPKMELIQEDGQMADFLLSLDILAVPSWQDTCASHILTAMALGIPVICFEGNAAVAEIIREAGLLVGSYDTREMASVIRKVSLDADSMSCIAVKERSRVEECFLDSGSPSAVLKAVDQMAVRF